MAWDGSVRVWYLPLRPQRECLLLRDLYAAVQAQQVARAPALLLLVQTHTPLQSLGQQLQTHTCNRQTK